MREATDLSISAGVRRELAGRRIDLGKIKFPVKAGVVTLQGELCFVGIEKNLDETAIELKFIESGIKSMPGVKEVIFELENWSQNDSGIWESSQTSTGNVSGPTGAAPAISGDGIVCPDCDYVIRFCPCCGKPLAGAGKSASRPARRPVPPVKPVLKKKKPAVNLSPVSVAPLSSPAELLKKSPEISKPAVPTSPTISSPPVVKSAPATPVAPITPVVPAGPAMPTSPASTTSQVSPTVPTPTHTAVPAAGPVLPPAGKPVAAPPPSVSAPPEKPAIKFPVQPDKPAAVVATPLEKPEARPLPKAPSVEIKPEPPAETASVSDTPDIFAGFSSDFAEKPEELPSEASDSEVPSTPPAKSEAPAFNFDDLLDSATGSIDSPEPQPTAMSEEPSPVDFTSDPFADKIPDASEFAIPAINNEPAVTEDEEDLLPPLKPLAPSSPTSAPPAVSELPPLDAFDLGDDTPLPPMKPAQPARPQVKDSFEDDTPLPPMKPAAPANSLPDPMAFEDDTPLPPMKPKAPPAKESKDPFAALFSGGDLNLGIPAENQAGAKDPFSSLDLDLDVLEVFPSDQNDAPALPAKKPAAATGKKPAPADENPFNLDNVIDLDTPVEDKTKSKPKASKDPFDLDDFDIKNFKL